MKESPIFAKTHDLLRWLIPATVKFPRQHRFVLAQALQRQALEFQGLLIEALHCDPQDRLARADAELDKLRNHLRLCLDLELLRPNQYAHVSGLLSEIGRLLGGWKKSLAGKLV